MRSAEYRPRLGHEHVSARPLRDDTPRAAPDALRIASLCFRHGLLSSACGHVNNSAVTVIVHHVIHARKTPLMHSLFQS